MAEDKVKKGPQSPKVIIDTSILDDKRVAELRAKAKESVDKERKAAAEAQLLEQFKLEERQAGGLEEEMREVYMDFAPYADRAMIDGVVYFQGRSYTLRASVAAVIEEMIAATWKHQSIVDGKSENFYRKQRSQTLSPRGGDTSHILRA